MKSSLSCSSSSSILRVHFEDEDGEDGTAEDWGKTPKHASPVRVLLANPPTTSGCGRKAGFLKWLLNKVLHPAVPVWHATCLWV